MEIDAEKLSAVPAFASCPCNSGKLHGQCCALVPATRYYLLKLTNGSAYVQVHGVKATLARKTAPPIAEWMIRAAAISVEKALQPEASEYETLVALLTVATALEAVVNRLLEPLLTTSEWPKAERKSAADKWSRLYSRVGVKPGLAPDRDPLRGFVGLVELRNTLVHFKHGKHVHGADIPVPASWSLGASGGELTVDMSKELPPLPTSPVYEQLNPSQARSFGAVMLAMLEPVLPLYPDDEFKIVAKLAAELEHMKRVVADR
jgi:hypothetical protein